MTLTGRGAGEQNPGKAKRLGGKPIRGSWYHVRDSHNGKEKGRSSLRIQEQK